ncbi:hypothetical protein BN903_153 [Halorubrum sp. AJ67]|nr:hypothetical protein BN903_153 [Halorubrum sp. AJ67]
MNRRRSKSDAISFVHPSEQGINSPFPGHRGDTFVKRSGGIAPGSRGYPRRSIHEPGFLTVVDD